MKTNDGRSLYENKKTTNIDDNQHTEVNNDRKQLGLNEMEWGEILKGH